MSPRSTAALAAFLLATIPVTSIHAQRTRLDEGGWRPEVRSRLEGIVAARAGRGETVVFDFDNTLVCRDIGEATFAAMLEARALSPGALPPGISPAFRLGDETVDVGDLENLAEYYEKFLSATEHQEGESAPYAVGYAWIVQVMAGKSPAEVVAFAAEAYAEGIGARDAADPERGQTRVHGYRRPFFYPEMVDLVALLLENGYEVRVVSASNAWSVRWMVTEVLNPLLAARAGRPIGIGPENVFGVSVLLRDRRSGRLFKDAPLAGSKDGADYAALDPGELAHYELTSTLVPPMPGYHGKVAAILAAVGPDRPYLIAGDSPNDHAMLDWARHRLWIARLEKPAYQSSTALAVARSRAGEWLVQPVLAERAPGFVRSAEHLEGRLRDLDLSRPHDSVRILRETGLLGGFGG